MSSIKSKAWSPLQPGDIIDVIAPGFTCTKEAIQGAEAYIHSLGFVPRIPQDIVGKDLICSNSQSVRLRHLKQALSNKTSKMIWCLRGGYGGIQLLPDLQKLKKPSQSKLFWGYSDATTLHLFLNQKWQWPTMHGPLLDRLGSNHQDPILNLQIQNILYGESDKIAFEGLMPLNKAAKTKKIIKAKLVGGNLTVLTSSVGTPWGLTGKNKILFLEDTGERAYRLDRMMNQLEQSKSLVGLKAILLGDFLGGPDKDGVSRVWEWWHRYAATSKIPIFSGLPVGHGEVQMPLPLNTSCELTMGRSPRLVCASGVNTKT